MFDKISNSHFVQFLHGKMYMWPPWALFFSVMSRGHLCNIEKISRGKFARSVLIRRNLLARCHVVILCHFCFVEMNVQGTPRAKLLWCNFCLARCQATTLYSIPWLDSTWRLCVTSLYKMPRGHIVQYLLARYCMVTLCNFCLATYHVAILSRYFWQDATWPLWANHLARNHVVTFYKTSWKKKHVTTYFVQYFLARYHMAILRYISWQDAT